MLGNIKLKLMVLVLCASFITLMSQDTVAYYSVIGKATNVVTSGDVAFKILEKTDQGTDFPEEGVYIMPGDVVSKKVSVESVCDHPFYLRVKIVYGINAEELPSEECFKLNIDKKNWILHDGWYYYKKVVKPGEITPNVFSHVEMVGSKIDMNYIGKTLTLTIKAQAVQAEHNPLQDGNTFTAAGWPKEDES